MKIKIIISTCLLLTFSMAYGQEIRLSYKIILNNNTGNRPAYATEEFIDSSVVWMNKMFGFFKRGIHFSREPTIEIGGMNTVISQNYYTTDDDEGLENQAEMDPDGFQWKEDRINIYLNNMNGGGSCSSPGDPVADEIILIGNGVKRYSTILHEIGHFFNLEHTFGNKCSDTCLVNESDDLVDDTVIDSDCDCHDDLDSIASINYNDVYANLNALQQDNADYIFHNLMSYHDRIAPNGLEYNRILFSKGQLDRWAQSIYDFQSRRDVIEGLPHYVDDDAICLFTCAFCKGSPNLEYDKFSCAYDAVSSGDDVIVLRPGQYVTDEFILDTPCIIAGTNQGDALLRFEE